MWKFTVLVLAVAAVAKSLPTPNKVNVATIPAVERGQLPCGFLGGVAVHDEGSNSIIVMGGERYGDCIPGTQILKYDIATETVEKIGDFPRVVQQGGAIILPSGDIYYFDGYVEEFDPVVYKFTVQNPNPVIVTSMPNNLVWPSVVYDAANDAAFILGGYIPMTLEPYNREIFKFSLSTEDFEEVDLLEKGRYAAGSAIVDGKVYLMGGTIDNYVATDDIVQWNPNTLEEDTFLTSDLPDDIRLASAISSGQYIWTVGGRIPEEDGTHQLSRFDTEALVGGVDEYTVDNFPQALNDFAIAFVPNLNRIYVIGGEDVFTGNSDKIYGIDLP